MPGLFENLAALQALTTAAPETISVDAAAGASEPAISAVQMHQSVLQLDRAASSPPGLRRDQVSAPIAPEVTPHDGLVYEDPRDPAAYKILPHYRIATELVAGQERFRVELSERALSLYLSAAPAPELAERSQALQAALIQPAVTAQLAFVELGHRHVLAFQEHSSYQDGRLIRAELKLAGLEQADRVLRVLTDTSYGTELSVRRSFEAATTHQLTRQALRFAQGNAYVEVPHRQTLGLAGGGSVELWANFQNAQANQKLIGKVQQGSPWSGWLVGVEQGRPYVELWDRAGGHHTLTAQTTRGAIPSGAWVHLTVTWGPGGHMVVYVNGQEVGRAALPLPLSENGQPVRLGISPWDPHYFHFRGLLRDVLVWDRQRSPDEVRADMEQPPTGAPGLVSHWSLDGLYEGRVVDLAHDWSASLAQEDEIRRHEAQVVQLRSAIAQAQGKNRELEAKLGRENRQFERLPLWQKLSANAKLTQVQVTVSIEREQLFRNIAALEQSLKLEEQQLAAARAHSGANHGRIVGPVESVPITLSAYQQQRWELEQLVDPTFTFASQLYPYIFPLTRPQGGGDEPDPIYVEDGPGDGQPFVYYRDGRDRSRFYYLPDSFGLRHVERRPLLALRFGSRAGLDLDDLYAELDYVAEPEVDRERLKRHAELLREQTGHAGRITFVPFFDTERAALQLEPASRGVANAPRLVSFQRGLLGTVRFETLEAFAGCWDALFSADVMQSLLTGRVTLSLGGGRQAHVSVRLRAEPGLDAATVLEQIFQTERITTFEKTVHVEAFGPLAGVGAITVGSGEETLQVQLDGPREIQALVLDFGKQSVSLTSVTPKASARVVLPLRDTLLSGDGHYSYSLNVMTDAGPALERQGRSDDEYLHIFLSGGR